MNGFTIKMGEIGRNLKSNIDRFKQFMAFKLIHYVVHSFKFLFYFSIFLLGFSTNMLAQTKQEDQKDLRDLLVELNIQKPDEDTAQRKIIAALVPAGGYSLATGPAILIAGSIQINPDEAGTNTSNVLVSLAYTLKNQVIFPLYANLWTKNNTWNLVSDFRFMDYPSLTYGAGPVALNGPSYEIDFNYLRLHQSLLRKVYQSWYLGTGIFYDRFWKIDAGIQETEEQVLFQQLGSQTEEKGVGLTALISSDKRDNFFNPHQGHYFNGVWRINKEWMGSDNPWQSLILDFRKYIPVGKRQNVLAIWSYQWLSVAGKTPYLMLPSTGWDDFYNTGRGYIQGRYRGKNLIYLEAEYRFQLSRNGLLGGTVFANGQRLTRRFGDFIPGYGAGVRIKVNKKSDTNLCIDYGFGINGSKGLFVNLGEVF
ncbi:MAG: hypothetical protein L6Q78_06455 [Bacteroidia bacterium]|nr:hypothetical protein [Bacteroidia bacterium]